MTDPIKHQIAMVSHEDIERVFEGTNFGNTPSRNIVNESVWKLACGYHNGSTANRCLVELGLSTYRASTSRFHLNANGIKYLRHCTMPIFVGPVSA